MRKLAALAVLAWSLATAAFGDAVIFSGDYVKSLRSQVNLFDAAYILTGTDDPTAVAKLAPKGSLYLRQTAAGDGALFVKLDTGSSTNWRKNDPTPPGVVVMYAGSTAPPGYVLGYGQPVPRTGATARLFAAIGTTYGVGDGSTTFNVPDCRGRALAGKDDMGGSAANRLTTSGSSVDGATLGATGGAQNVTLTGAQSGVAVHTHGAGSYATTLGLTGSAASGTFSSSGHTHSTPNHAHLTGYKYGDYTWHAYNSGGGLSSILGAYNWAAGGVTGADRTSAIPNQYTYTNTSGGGTSGGPSATASVSGGSWSLTGSNTVAGTSAAATAADASSAHLNVQPTIVMNCIVKE